MNEFEERRHMRWIDTVYIIVFAAIMFALLNISGLNITEVTDQAIDIAYFVLNNAN
jgi:hypothetical protein